MNKLFLVIYNKKEKFSWVKYFETEFELDKYKRKIKYIKDLFIIEDSRDTLYLDYDK